MGGQALSGQVAPHSALYSGWVRHRRYTPKAHAFRYPLQLFYLDLDELPQLLQGRWLWSFERFNLGCYRRRDYHGDPHIPLKQAVQQRVLALAGYCPQGTVRMLTQLRLLGVCFNPVTLYYLFEPEAALPSGILAEVTNTPWQERHSYWVPCNPSGTKTQTDFAKTFHVSPFNPTAMHYHWASTAPGEHLIVHMENRLTPDAPLVMDATLNLTRQAWSAKALASLLLRHPFNALKVPITIYWQALKLWLKGNPVYNHPSSASGDSP